MHPIAVGAKVFTLQAVCTSSVTLLAAAAAAAACRLPLSLGIE
jgi:hypothetical protein